MDRHKVANIISRCRRQKGVQQEVLCRGICSNANYSRIESGDAEIPLVMVQAFLGRLCVAGTAIGGGGLQLLSEAAGH